MLKSLLLLLALSIIVMPIEAQQDKKGRDGLDIIWEADYEKIKKNTYRIILKGKLTEGSMFIAKHHHSNTLGSFRKGWTVNGISLNLLDMDLSKLKILQKPEILPGYRPLKNQASGNINFQFPLEAKSTGGGIQVGVKRPDIGSFEAPVYNYADSVGLSFVIKILDDNWEELRYRCQLGSVLDHKNNKKRVHYSFNNRLIFSMAKASDIPTIRVAELAMGSTSGDRPVVRLEIKD